MFSRYFGKRNPEKDIERILVDLKGSGQISTDGSGTYFITPDAGHDITGSVDLVYNPATNFRNGLEMVESAENIVHGRFLAPAAVGTNGSINIKTVLSYDGTGNIYARHGYSANYCNVTFGHSTGLQSYSAISLADESGTWVACVGSYDMTSLSTDDFITFYIQRDGTHGSDTYSGGNVWVMGFLLTV